MSDAKAKIRDQLIVVQTTPFCNVDCAYCYLPDRSRKDRIDDGTLRRIAHSLYSSALVGNDLRILWHAGEPLVLPVAFYENFISIFSRNQPSDAHIRYSVQTNATLITEEWCDFFRRHDIRVGVSLDGPRKLHDAQRVTRRKTGTWAAAMRGVELLRRNEIPFSVITVLTERSLGMAEEIWDFYQANGMSDVAFNPEEKEGANVDPTLTGDVHVRRYTSFLATILRLWSRDPSIRVREIDEMLKSFRLSHLPLIAATNHEFRIFTFDWQGNVSTFAPELVSMTSPRHGRLVFGNVNTQSLDEIFASSDRYRAVREEVERGKRRCAETCEYFVVCGGGSPSNKLSELGTMAGTETLHCRLVAKATCDAVLEHLESSLAM